MKIRTITLLATSSALAIGAVPSFAAAPASGSFSVVPAGEVHDVEAHLRVTGKGLELAVGGARLELYVIEDGRRSPQSRRRATGTRELWARLEVDGRRTNLLLRFVPPPADGPPPRR